MFYWRYVNDVYDLFHIHRLLVKRICYGILYYFTLNSFVIITACDQKCQLECLKMHNYYRALHDSPPLSCDPELARSAQDWTDQQAADGRMYHSKWTSEFTESISWKGWGWEGMDKMEGAIPGAVRSWYSEIKFDYNYEAGEGNGQAIGHFQAVTWKGEKRLGCGLNIKAAGAKAGTFVTAHYAPASHVSMDKKKQAPDNIKPRKQPGQCVETKQLRLYNLRYFGKAIMLDFKCYKNYSCYGHRFNPVWSGGHNLKCPC